MFVDDEVSDCRVGEGTGSQAVPYTWKWYARTGVRVVLILVWPSVLIITYGTYLKAESVTFQHYVRNLIETSGGEGPGDFVGVAICNSFPIVGAFFVLVAYLFTGSMLTLRLASALLGVIRPLILLFSCLLWSSIMVLSAIEAATDLRWGFLTAAFGYLLLSITLALGAVLSAFYVTYSDPE